MRRAHLRNSGKTQLKLKLFVPLVLSGIVFAGSALFFYLQLGTSKSVHAGVETFPSGSYIINMGVTPQTVQNGLKPYGLIYEMITTYKIPVKWIINGSKVKDGVDFVYNGVNYSGGCFLIHGDLITPAIQGRITYWNGLGVQGIYTTSAISVPVYNTINSFPRTVIDTLSGNQSIISSYFSNAGIPSTAYSLGRPSSITSCHDLWVNPHGDPVWSTHGALYNFSTVDKGYIWSQCHSVSMLEKVSNPSSPSQKMNFLSTTGLQCYGSSKCGSVTEVHSKPPTAPYTNSFPSDPVMQFMGNLSGACLGGSEQWYVPLSTGSWRASTIRLVTTSNGASPREGVLMAYGPAHGNSANGLVMYLGGHDLNGNGSTAEKVAAQRAFLNFCLLAGKGKTPQLSSSSIQTSFVSGMTGSVSVNVTGGTAPYTYQWTSSISGTFGSPTAATTTFTPTLSGSNQNGSITLTITDACGRISFETRPITSSGSALPISLLWTKAEKITDAVMVKWATSSEKNNDFFTVHRSINNGTFEQIARVKGQGNSNSFKEYHYQDKMAPFGKLLYRISQTDYDGTTAIFDPVALTNLMEIKSAIIFPNPFSERADVRFDSETGGQVEIEIRNSKGQLIHRSTYSSQSGMNSFKMPGIESVSAGSYFLRIITDKKESKTIPFIKN